MFTELAPGQVALVINQGGKSELYSQFLDVLKETWQTVPAAARDAILAYYQGRTGTPQVMFGLPENDRSPLACAGGTGTRFMMWANAMQILALPGGKDWSKLVLAEELAHAFCTATNDPTHISEQPSKDLESKEYKEWNDARENAMKHVLDGWPFDSKEHDKVVSWAKGAK